jgi:hypothetical protein
MPFTSLVTWSVFASGVSVQSSREYSGGQQIAINEIIISGATNQLVSLALDVSQIQSLILVSSRNVTLKTNNATTPTNTINLVANVPYIWNIDSYDTNKLTADVTSLFVTNSSGADALLRISAVLDPTP